MPNLPPPNGQRIEVLEDLNARLTIAAARSDRALRHLTHGHKLRFACHAAALVVETIGTLLIYLDTLRLDAQLHAAGFSSYAGEPPLQYHHWYYHHAGAGFALLLLGILAQGFVIWFEHRVLERTTKAMSNPLVSAGLSATPAPNSQ